MLFDKAGDTTCPRRAGPARHEPNAAWRHGAEPPTGVASSRPGRVDMRRVRPDGAATRRPVGAENRVMESDQRLSRPADLAVTVTGVDWLQDADFACEGPVVGCWRHRAGPPAPPVGARSCGVPLAAAGGHTAGLAALGNRWRTASRTPTSLSGHDVPPGASGRVRRTWCAGRRAARPAVPRLASLCPRHIASAVSRAWDVSGWPGRWQRPEAAARIGASGRVVDNPALEDASLGSGTGRDEYVPKWTARRR
jgi:hypothetical protein